MDIFFWWSVVSTLLSLIFLGLNIWQLAINKKEKEIHKAQVKIWQHFANGINHNLIIMGEALKQDLLGNLSARGESEIIRGIQSNINALYTSLNEERLFEEEEIKQRQLEQEKKFQKFLEKNNQE